MIRYIKRKLKCFYNKNVRFFGREVKIMRWKQVVQRKHYHGELRYSTVFAWLPIRCENGDCAWLKKVNLVEEYRIDPTGHWINKKFE